MKNAHALILGSSKDYNFVSKKIKKDTGAFVEGASFKDLQINIQTGKSQILWDGKDIKSYDYVWILSSWKYRQIAHIASKYLDMHGIAHTPVEREKTKLVDTFNLAMSNVNVPKTMFISTIQMKSSINSIVKYCSFPFLIKATRGSLGKGIFLVNSRNDAYSVLKQLDPIKVYMIQEFIPNLFDYRVIISNGRPVSIGKRTRIGDDFRNNAALGANEDFMDANDVPEDVLQIAIESAKSAKLDWCGVDVVVCDKTGESFVLEINRRPGLTAKSTERLAAIKHFSAILSDIETTV